MLVGVEHGSLILTRVWCQNGDCIRIVSMSFLLHIVPFFQVVPSRLRASAHSVVMWHLMHEKAIALYYFVNT